METNQAHQLHDVTESNGRTYGHTHAKSACTVLGCGSKLVTVTTVAAGTPVVLDAGRSAVDAGADVAEHTTALDAPRSSAKCSSCGAPRCIVCLETEKHYDVTDESPETVRAAFAARPPYRHYLMLCPTHDAEQIQRDHLTANF